MITVGLDAATLGRVRLAPSPAHEITAWLRLAAAGRRHPVYGDPGALARHALRYRDVALVAQVLLAGRDGYLPDLLTPKPGPGVCGLPMQLEAISATPPAEAAQQLALIRAREMPGAVRAAMESGTFARRAASGLAWFWKSVVADRWPGLKAVFDADLADRAATIAARGMGELLGSLHEGVRWTGRRLELAKPYDESLRLADAELVLAPAAMSWPAFTVQCCDPGNAVLTYPVRGLGAVTPDPPNAVPTLIGASRTRILRDLDVPRSTRELSARHSLAPATVSYHLGVLHRAGLIGRTRDSHRVLYQRTGQGNSLLGMR